MAKKRGGRRHKEKPADEPDFKIDVEPYVHSEGPGVQKEEKPPDHITVSKNRSIETRALIDYAKCLRPALMAAETSLKTAKTAEDLEDATLLLKQALTEFHNKEAILLKDQKGSRVLQQLLMQLQTAVIKIVDLEAKKGGTDTFDPPVSLSHCIDAIKRILRVASTDAYSFATDFYASHVLEILLKTAPNFLDTQKEVVDAPSTTDGAAQESEDASDACSLADQIAIFVNALIASGFGDIMCHPAGTHVARAAVSALCGMYYAPEDLKQLITTSRNRVKDTVPVTQSSRVDFVLKHTFSTLLKQLVDAVKESPGPYAENTHGGAFLVYLLKLLDQTQDFLKCKETAELVSILLLTKNDSEAPEEQSSSIFVTLAKAPVGSRILEAAVSLATAETLDLLIQNIVIERFSEVACDPYGNFVIQSICRHRHLSEASCVAISGKADAAELLRRAYPGVLFRLLEAQKRLKCYSAAARLIKQILKALKASKSKKQLVWWTILGLVQADKLPVALQKRLLGSDDFGQSSDVLQDAVALDSAVLDSGKACLEAAVSQLKIEPLGCSILSVLAGFPADIVPMLHESFCDFASPELAPFLVKLAKDRQGSYILQSLLDPLEGMSEEERCQLARSFLGHYKALVLDSRSSFVAGSAFKGSDVETRKLIFEELRPIAQDIRKANFNIYRIMRFEEYLKDNSSWVQTQSKKDKVTALFSDILRKPDEGARKRIHESNSSISVKKIKHSTAKTR